MLCVLTQFSFFCKNVAEHQNQLRSYFSKAWSRNCFFSAITCPALAIPANGDTIACTDGYGYDSVCTFSCAEGYGLFDGASRTNCQGDGSSTTGAWVPVDGTMPACEGIQFIFNPYNYHLLCQFIRLTMYLKRV